MCFVSARIEPQIIVLLQQLWPERFVTLCLQSGLVSDKAFEGHTLIHTSSVVRRDVMYCTAGTSSPQPAATISVPAPGTRHVTHLTHLQGKVVVKRTRATWPRLLLLCRCLLWWVGDVGRGVVGEWGAVLMLGQTMWLTGDSARRNCWG